MRDEPFEDVLDLRVIAQRDRHEADASRMRPRGLGDRENPLAWRTARTGR